MSLAQHAPTRAAAKSRPDYHRVMMLDELHQDINRAIKMHKPSIFLGRLRPRDIEFVILPCIQEVKDQFHTLISALEIGHSDQIDSRLLNDLFKRATQAHNSQHTRKVSLGSLRAREITVGGTTYGYYVYRIHLQGD